MKLRAINLKQKIPFHTWQFAAVVALFLAIGSLFIYRSLATNVSYSTDTDYLLAQYDISQGALPQLVDGVADQEVLPFRLYGNGLAICGNNPTNSNSSKTAPYYSKQLSAIQTRGLVDQLVAAGSMNLKTIYSINGKTGTDNNSSLVLNLSNQVVNSTHYNDGSPTPAEFQKVVNVVQKFCNSLTTPYVASSVRIVTKQVTPEVQAARKLQRAAPNLSTKARLANSKPESATVTGETAKQISQETNTFSAKLIQKDNKYYEAKVFTDLPPVKPVPTKSDKKVSFWPFKAKKAVAAGTIPIKFVLFCASDACGPKPVGDYGNQIAAFYQWQVGKKFDLSAPSTYRGRYTVAYYTQCHAALCPKVKNPDCEQDTCGQIDDVLANTWNNIKAEMNPTQPTQVLLAFGTGTRHQCGLGDHPKIENPIGNWLSVTDDSYPGGWARPGYTNSCSVDYNVQKTMAHELGHNFSLSHIPGNTIMTEASACAWLFGCAVNSAQIAVLKERSPYFYWELKYRSITANNDGGTYTADTFGGLHAAHGAPAANASAFYLGWEIVRAVAVNNDKAGYTLDGFGGLHPFGGAPATTQYAYWPGWDIARDIKLIGNGTQGYTLDGFGGLHSVRYAPAPHISSYWSGWDIAHKFDIKNNGQGGYVLDGFGGLHAFSTGTSPPLPQITNAAYFGRDITRGIALRPNGSQGYTLDMSGGVHPFSIPGTLKPPAISNGPYWPGGDVARDIVITNWNGKPRGYLVDYLGVVWPIGG